MWEHVTTRLSYQFSCISQSIRTPCTNHYFSTLAGQSLCRRKSKPVATTSDQCNFSIEAEIHSHSPAIHEMFLVLLQLVKRNS
jgi:hypothetical protein